MDGNLVLLTVDGDLDRVHGGVVDLVVGSVNKNLVKNLEETRDVGDRTKRQMDCLSRISSSCVLTG